MKDEENKFDEMDGVLEVIFWTIIYPWIAFVVDCLTSPTPA